MQGEKTEVELEVEKEEEEKKLLHFLAADQYNGFGFQADGTDVPGQLLVAQICVLDHSSNPLESIFSDVRRQTGSETAECVTWIGRSYLGVHYREWDLISIMLQTLIDRGDVTVRMHCALGCTFSQGDTFSWSEMERRLIEDFKKRALKAERQSDEFTESDDRSKRWTWTDTLDMYPKGHVLKKNFNWHTAQGKQFCAELRTALGKKPASSKQSRYEWPDFDRLCKKYKVLHRGTWSAYEPSLESVDSFIVKECTEVSTLSSPSSLHDESKNDAETTGASNNSANNTVQSKKRKLPTCAETDNKRSNVATENLDDAKESAELNECAICMDRLANTLVLPCMHSVVCRVCSEGLKQTGDRKICVRCRNPIESVLCDESPNKF